MIQEFDKEFYPIYTAWRLSDQVEFGKIQLNQIGRLNDEQIIQELVKVKGIGIWTAQMFQMSALKRLDVFAPGDAGLIKGIRIVYFKGKPITETAVAKITNKWKPYRSIGSWYMWQVANTQKLQ